MRNINGEQCAGGLFRLYMRGLAVLACCIASSSLQAQEDTDRQLLFPDIPETWAEATRYKNEYFSIAFLFSALLDYTIFDQDQQSIDQVGKQENQFDRRSFRFVFAGTLDFIGPWSYLLAAEYAGFAREPEDPIFNFTDVSLTRHFSGGTRRLTIGKQKQAFIYEMVGDAANLTHHERFLEPFFVARSWGVSYTRTFVEKRVGLQLGWYNDWFVDNGDFTGDGNQWVARLTGLPRPVPPSRFFSACSGLVRSFHLSTCLTLHVPGLAGKNESDTLG